MYEYKAKVIKVIDGDTIDVEVDLGWKITIKDRLRLGGIDTPETRTRDKEEKKKGLEAKQFVIDKIEGKEVLICTEKQGKFGRYLADVYYSTDEAEDFDTNLNQLLVSRGLAKIYHGGKR